MASAISDLSALGSAGSGNERFNAEAASWDSRPFVHAASLEASKAILDSLRWTRLDVSTIDNLEIGCGTGILSFLLAPHFRRIVAIDAAEGMISMLKEKLSKPSAPQNITPIAKLLKDPEDECLPFGDDGSRMKFDLITSHLVLHHVPDLASLFKTMYNCLKPGGFVLLTDFENFGDEARRFHPEDKMGGVVTHGMKREVMKALLEDAGFYMVDVDAGWTMKKTVAKKNGPGEEEMEFPFVLCRGQRKD